VALKFTHALLRMGDRRFKRPVERFLRKKLLRARAFPHIPSPRIHDVLQSLASVPQISLGLLIDLMTLVF